MKSIEIYKKILLKVNLNDTNGNIHAPKSNAVLIFNEESRKWLNSRLENSNNSDEKDELHEFLISDVELKKVEDLKDSSDFAIPNDYFRYSRSYSLASKGECKNRVIVNWDIKNKNINTILTNSNESPSFEYEESPVKLANFKLKVYKSDFSVDKVFLDYYKLPPILDISGYTRFDGTKSEDVDLKYSDDLLDQIISQTALAIVRNSQNTEGFQFAKDRIASEPRSSGNNGT